MDLRSLLNQGGSGLSIHDLLALQHSDNNEKLNKLNGVVFDYPTNSNDTYRFFDAFIQLVLSIQDDDDEFGLQYANTLIIGALRTCISGLLQQEGFQWLVSYPSHLSDMTWTLLESRPDTTFLNYLYGLALGLKKQDSIPFEGWIQSILHFLRAKSPALTCHIWLNFCYLDDRHRLVQEQQKCARAAFLTAMETDFSQMLYGFLETMTSPGGFPLISKLEGGLGGTLLRDQYTQQDITNTVSSLEHSIRTWRTNYPLLSQELNRFITEQINIGLDRKPQKLSEVPSRRYDLILKYPTLVTKDILNNLPLDSDTRSRLFQQTKKRWIQAMGTLLPDDFNGFLQQLIVTLYPSRKNCILDSVLMDWVARDPFGCHRELIVGSLMRLMGSYDFDNTWAPYSSLIQAFEITGYGKNIMTTEGYNIKTGAEINLSKFSTKHDAAIVKGLGETLQLMMRRSSDTSETWMVNCLSVSSPDVIRQYFEWLVQQVNQEFDADPPTENTITPFASHLHGIFARPEISPIAPFVVPTLLRRASEHTLAWILQKKNDRVRYLPSNPTRYNPGSILIAYFTGGTDLSSKHLVTDLIHHKSEQYMDCLFTYLRQKILISEKPAERGSQSWFCRHFMEAILLETSKDSGQQCSVASGLYRQLLLDKRTFNQLLTLPYVATGGSTFDLLECKFINILKKHSLMMVRDTGMATLLHCVTQLDEPQQKRLTEIWMDLWITSDDKGMKQEGRLCVPDSMVLQCIGLYDQAPVIMRQMMELFIKLGIKSRVHGGGEQVNTMGGNQTFNQKIMDLFMLSDAPEVDGLLDLYLQLSYTLEASSETDQEEMVDAVVNTLIELVGEINVFFKYPVYQKSSGRQAIKPKNESSPLDEFDEYTRMAENGPSSGGENSMDELDSNPLGNTSRKSRKLLHSLSLKQSKKQASLSKALAAKKLNGQPRLAKRQEKDEQPVRGKRRKLNRLVSKDMELSTKEETQRLNLYEGLVTLLQRLLNFILVIVSDADENSLCPIARKSVRNKMIRNFLLYEPLATLNQLDELPTNILNDIQVVIDISIDYLEKNGDTDTQGIIQRILTPQSSA